MRRRRESIVAVLIGNAESPEKAAAMVETMETCPYVSLYVASERLVVGVFALPLAKRWWIEYPAEHPELLGLGKAAVYVTDGIEASSPWTRGAVEPMLSAAPCGSACEGCPQYRRRCRGCPATVWYRSR